MKLFFENVSSLKSDEDYLDRFLELYDLDAAGIVEPPGMFNILTDWLSDHPTVLRDIVNYLNNFVHED